MLFVYGLMIALSARRDFARLVGIGLTTTFFLYVFVNVAMVTGLIPGWASPALGVLWRHRRC